MFGFAGTIQTRVDQRRECVSSRSTIGARRSAGHQNWLYGPSRTPVSTPRVCNALGSFARLRTTARAVGRHIWRNTYWPDYAVVWWHSAVRRASLLMNIRPYDAVVSVSLPFTGHFVAWSLSRRLVSGGRLPWIADIGDPFSFPGATLNNEKLYGRLNRWADSQVLHDASLVTVTTQETKSQYTQNFPGLSGNISDIFRLCGPVVSGDAVRTVPHPQGNTERRGKAFCVYRQAIPGNLQPRGPIELVRVVPSHGSVAVERAASLRRSGRLRD